MKLKNVLILAFLTLTIIPIVIVSFLLYKSGYELAKESYIRNLTESISVQADYIVQTIDSNMISDYHFSKQNILPSNEDGSPSNPQKKDLHTAFQSYLESLGDRISVCLLLDKDNLPIYTIGESATLDTINANLPPLSQLEKQTIIEFEIEPGVYSLGIATPMRNADDAYAGCLISIYDPAYLFKIISSYYKIADTSTYICRANGDTVNSRTTSDDRMNAAIENALAELSFSTEGVVDMRSGNVPISGYYKNIGNSPWYLVGFIDEELVNSFTNQYVLTYILIIIGVVIAAMILAFYFSRRVVEPINSLIQVMEGYPGTLSDNELQTPSSNGYFETRYLRTKFFDLMKRISLVQHNFEGVYKLYQSGDMSDTNIDIDTKEQTISSNKEVFQTLINELEASPNACIVERFINCFSEKDQDVLMGIFENMRDRHLSVPCETEVYTPHLNNKWFHTLVVPMYENDCLSHLFIQLRDITAFKKQELESSEEARRDSLTGLYNRSGFTQYANTALRTKTTPAFHALLFIDMDYFKMVNDNFGHSEGDNLLRSVGEALKEVIPANGVASRYGGDEFAAFLPNTSEGEVSQVTETLRKRLVYPFTADKVSFVVTASIGVSFWSGDAPSTLEELLYKADSAMYQMKRRIKQEENQ